MQLTSAPSDAGAAQSRALLALRKAIGEQAFCIFIDPTLKDPLMADELLADAYRALQTQGMVAMLRLPHIHDNFDPDRQPYVLHVRNQFDTERLLNASLRLAWDEATAQRTPDARTVCGWLPSHQSGASVVKWLASQAKIVRPDGQFWYLRFWDPRVVWQLPRVLEPAHLARLQAGMSTWCYLDADLQIACPMNLGAQPLGSPAQPVHLPVSPASAPLRIRSATWSRMLRIEAINRVLVAFPDSSLHANAETAQRIEHFIERSAAAGFPEIDDAVTFACAALVSHPRFDEHPSVAAALAGSPSVAVALGGFDDAFWNQLREGNWLAELLHPVSAP